jgi:alpha-D-ribose 1-methylphosphonate 5-triphosphate diphosphatase
MISIMDHTPGQRQFRNTDKYKEYLAGKYQLSDEEMENHFSKLKALQSKNSEIHIKKISEAQMRFQCVLASHDDTTIEDVLSSKNLGVSIAEFPTTIEAAKESQKEDMKIIMGSPNLMRGGSHSGNISAQELIDENCLDIFSSDYIPSSLLSSAVKWGLESGNMPKAIASISRNPAIATQLLDRGSIQCGMKADLVSFSIYNNLPIVKKVWVSGQAI